MYDGCGSGELDIMYFHISMTFTEHFIHYKSLTYTTRIQILYLLTYCTVFLHLHRDIIWCILTTASEFSIYVIHAATPAYKRSGAIMLPLVLLPPLRSQMSLTTFSVASMSRTFAILLNTPLVPATGQMREFEMLEIDAQRRISHYTQVRQFAIL